MTELQAKAIKRINEAFDMASKFYNMSFILPTISFKLKGRRAGYAQCFVNKIALNNDMLHANGDTFINDTPGHEAAHLIARHVYGYTIAPHGCEWKKVMRVIGQEPSRCHTFEVVTRHQYFCNCNDRIFISTTKHNRILKNRAKYQCMNCKTEIRWKKLYEKTTIFPSVVSVNQEVTAAANY